MKLCADQLNSSLSVLLIQPETNFGAQLHCIKVVGLPVTLRIKTFLCQSAATCFI